MAKKNLGRLAGLAALAGAAYMGLKDKDKDKGSDSNSTRAARPESTETRLKSPAESIAAADKSDKSTSISTKGEAGTTTPGTDKSVPILDVKPAPAVPKKATAPRTSTTAKTDSTRRDLEAGTSRGIPAKQKPVSTVSSSAEDMKNYKPRVTPSAASAPKPKDSAPTSTTTSTPKSEPYKHKMPISSFFEGIRERGNKDLEERGLRGGGKVKKMASGGMTASKRADGIASRGKTNCKMY